MELARIQGGGTALGVALRSVPDPVREVFDEEPPDALLVKEDSNIMYISLFDKI